MTPDSQLSRCYANQQSFWEVIHGHRSVAETGRERPRDSLTVDPNVQTRVFTSVSDSIHFVDSVSSTPVDVLVTGSLHLVGTVMSVLGFSVDDM